MKNTPEYCPVCDSPAELVSRERTLKFGHRKVTVLDERMQCPQCGEEFYLPEQIEATEKRGADKIRLEEGLLSSSEIKQTRIALGLTQREFELLLGVGEKTAVRWETGNVCPNAATNELIWLIGANPANAKLLARRRNSQFGRAVKARTPLAETRVLPFERRLGSGGPSHFVRENAPTRSIGQSEETILSGQQAGVG